MTGNKEKTVSNVYLFMQCTLNQILLQNREVE